MDKKSPDVRYICRISGWDFKHLAVRGWFRLQIAVDRRYQQKFQSPLGEWVVQTSGKVYQVELIVDKFQSPRGEGVVQTSLILISF